MARPHPFPPPPATADAEGALYLATGDLPHLKNATQAAEAAAGWRAALPWALRMLCISPLNPASAQLMFAVLDSGSQTDLLEEMARQLFEEWFGYFRFELSPNFGDGRAG